MKHFYLIFLFLLLLPMSASAVTDPSGDFVSCASGETWQQDSLPRWADLIWSEDVGESPDGYQFRAKFSDNFMNGTAKDRPFHFSINLDLRIVSEYYSVSAVFNGSENKWSKSLLKNHLPYLVFL